MKKIIAGILSLFIALTLFSSNEAFARKNKKELLQQQKRLEYLNLDWWKHFDDEQLTLYMQELYNENKDLKIAAYRVKEGENLVKISLSNAFPQVSFNGDFGRIMSSSNTQYGDFVFQSYAQNMFLMPLTATYEVDIWGKNRFKTLSTEKQLEMIEQDEKATYITLTSAFATEYYNLIKINKLIDIQQEIVNTQNKIIKKAEKQYEHGLTSENELLIEKKILTSYQEELNNLVKTKHVIENQLKVYLADSNHAIATSAYENVEIPEDITETFNSTIIDKRPDYIKAETYIKKIGYDVSIAKREFLPNFIIYGQIGYRAYDWSNMFKSFSQLANVGILPNWDLFSGGRKFAILRLKKYQYQEALEHYKNTILTSMQELNDNTIIYKTAKENYNQAKERLNLENKKYNHLIVRNEAGAISDFELLQNKKRNLLTQKDEISRKINCINSIIGIYKATGGQDLYKLNSTNNL